MPSFISHQMQIKTTMREQYRSKDVKQLELSYTVSGRVEEQSHLGKLLGTITTKAEHMHTLLSSKSTPKVYSIEICTQV